MTKNSRRPRDDGNVILPVMKQFFVCMLATRKDGPLYVGVTSDLRKRAYEHRSRAGPGFTKRYNVHRLVWFEPHDNAESAILREKRLKRWQRAWKKTLIEESNPRWDDLFETLGPS